MTVNPQTVNSGIQGYAPVNQQVSDFQVGEQLGLSGGTAFVRTGATGIDLLVPSFLLRRKVYGYIIAANSNASYYWAKCVVNFLLNKTNVGTLPLAIGNKSAVPAGGDFSDIFSLFQSSVAGTSVGDSLIAYLSNPTGAQPASTVLSPLYLTGQFDEVIVTCNSLQNVTDLRLILAVVSTSP